MNRLETPKDLWPPDLLPPAEVLRDGAAARVFQIVGKQGEILREKTDGALGGYCSAEAAGDDKIAYGFILTIEAVPHFSKRLFTVEVDVDQEPDVVLLERFRAEFKGCKDVLARALAIAESCRIG